AYFVPRLMFIEVKLPPKPAEGETVQEGATAPQIQGDFYLFSPKTWEGQMVFDLDLARFTDPAGAIETITPPAHVVLYRKSCDHCKAHLEELALNPPADQSMVLVRIPELDDANVENIIELKPEGALEIELVPLPRGYGITTPLSFDVDEAFLVNSVTEIQVE
ncbi:MAG TPA: hypothetical protein P5218_08080, partial [Planctomycetota bacterium]|nr:hypothetical protein [Planctomycetota bacterium]